MTEVSKVIGQRWKEADADTKARLPEPLPMYLYVLLSPCRSSALGAGPARYHMSESLPVCAGRHWHPALLHSACVRVLACVLDPGQGPGQEYSLHAHLLVHPPALFVRQTPGAMGNNL